ncbi:hypothetical protein WN943_027757 [Citrus x changshan-huyou]
MDRNEILAKLHNRFPSLPQNALLTIYKTWSERMRLLMKNNIPVDIRWLIEAKWICAKNDSPVMTIIPERACTILSRESDYKRPCLPVYKKNGWEAYPRPIEGVQAVSRRKTRGRSERKLHLVYGGGNRGLSKLVSEAAFVRGSQVLSIIPSALKPLGSLSDSPTGEELFVSGMQERITEMLNYADAFIFLPGDLATLEALITLASWTHLHIQ